MPVRGNHGPVIQQALEEAYRRFGKPTQANMEQIARWVQRRVRVLAGEAEPEPKDGKAARVAEGDE